MATATKERKAGPKKQPNLNLPGYKPSAQEVAAREVLVAKEKMEEAEDTYNNKVEILLEEMEKAKLKFMTLDGHEFKITVTEEKTKLTVK